MAEVRRHMAVPAERVWAQLGDGWIFPTWVVGATHIRDVDADWPAPGSRIHHKVGVWPLVINDTTQVLEAEAPFRLVLQARAWPLGEARIELDISEDGDGSTVTMRERPTHGVARWLHSPVQEALLRWRNREAIDRLATLAERRGRTVPLTRDRPGA
jgi:uncharacterized protein YndB with AHSA1/START domain